MQIGGLDLAVLQWESRRGAPLSTRTSRYKHAARFSSWHSATIHWQQHRMDAFSSRRLRGQRIQPRL